MSKLKNSKRFRKSTSRGTKRKKKFSKITRKIFCWSSPWDLSGEKKN
jgi:hypothetical protein